MRNVRTINLAVVSSHIEPYGTISDQITPEILSIYGIKVYVLSQKDPWDSKFAHFPLFSLVVQ